MQNIGQSVTRVDARGKVTGVTPYSGDLSMPGMLHMKMLFAERPHARIKSIETGAAEAAPGVVAVFTAKDVPVNEYGLQWQDQPVPKISRPRHKPEPPAASTKETWFELIPSCFHTSRSPVPLQEPGTWSMVSTAGSTPVSEELWSRHRMLERTQPFSRLLLV